MARDVCIMIITKPYILRDERPDRPSEGRIKGVVLRRYENMLYCAAVVRGPVVGRSDGYVGLREAMYGLGGSRLAEKIQPCQQNEGGSKNGGLGQRGTDGFAKN